MDSTHYFLAVRTDEPDCLLVVQLPCASRDQGDDVGSLLAVREMSRCMPKWSLSYLPVTPRDDKRPATHCLNVDHVFAFRLWPHVAEYDVLGIFSVPVAIILIQGQRFVVAQCVYHRIGEEAGMVDRGTMVQDLKQCIIFVREGSIVDINEAVRASGQQMRCNRRMEFKLRDQSTADFVATASRTCLGYVVVMAFHVFDRRQSGRSVVPAVGVRGENYVHDKSSDTKPAPTHETELAQCLRRSYGNQDCALGTGVRLKGLGNSVSRRLAFTRC